VIHAPDGLPTLARFEGFDEIRRYLLDVPKAALPDLVKRLSFYKLRAKVQIAEVIWREQRLGVVAAWGSDRVYQTDALFVRDMRHPDLGERLYLIEGDAEAISVADPPAYHAHRIALGIPEGGVDFAYGDVYPHDVDMDQIGGVDFKKGCYVGQEVVSRMEHRGTARRRFVQVSAESDLPAAGTPLTAGTAAIGTLGSSVGGAGLALVRLDRAKAAIDAGTPIAAAGVPLNVALPTWAKFTWPATVAADD
jgi:folate-binding protein YgfZ